MDGSCRTYEGEVHILFIESTRRDYEYKAGSRTLKSQLSR